MRMGPPRARGAGDRAAFHGQPPEAERTEKQARVCNQSTGEDVVAAHH